jgi:hypothetical protein
MHSKLVWQRLIQMLRFIDVTVRRRRCRAPHDGGTIVPRRSVGKQIRNMWSGSERRNDRTSYAPAMLAVTA